MEFVIENHLNHSKHKNHIYYYLERYFIKKDIKYYEHINEELLDLLCESIWEYLNLL